MTDSCRMMHNQCRSCDKLPFITNSTQKLHILIILQYVSLE